MNDKIAIYLRLSLADGDLKKSSKDESNSIENQRMLLHDYMFLLDMCGTRKVGSGGRLTRRQHPA